MTYGEVEEKDYLEIKYNDDKDPVVLEVYDWSLENVIDSENVKRVRFFKLRNNMEGSRIVRTSPWIYYGKRIDIKTAKEMFGNNPEYEILLGNIERNKLSAFHSQSGDLLILDEENLTCDEYNEKYKEHKIKMAELQERLENDSSNRKKMR